jgi:hypothetical protein
MPPQTSATLKEFHWSVPRFSPQEKFFVSQLITSPSKDVGFKPCCHCPCSILIDMHTSTREQLFKKTASQVLQMDHSNLHVCVYVSLAFVCSSSPAFNSAEYRHQRAPSERCRAALRVATSQQSRHTLRAQRSGDEPLRVAFHFLYSVTNSAGIRFVFSRFDEAGPRNGSEQQKDCIESLLVGPNASSIKCMRPEFIRLAPPLHTASDEVGTRLLVHLLT